MNSAFPVHVLFALMACQAEIKDLEVATRTHKQIAWLNVLMDDTCVMSVLPDRVRFARGIPVSGVEAVRPPCPMRTLKDIPSRYSIMMNTVR